MINFVKNKTAWIYLFIIILTGGLLRFIGVLNWQGLSFDEIISISISLQPWNELWTYLKWEMHPPLHFVFLKSWISAFGSSEVAIRLSSVFLGTLIIGGMYYLGRILYKSPKAGIIAATLAALNSTLIYRSLIARMYGPLLLGAIIASYFLYKALFASPKKSYWTLFGLGLWIALYTHLTAISLIVIFGAYVGILKYQNKISTCSVRNFAITTGIVILTYIPWIWHFLFVRLPDMQINAWYLFAQPKEIFFFTIPTMIMFGEANTFTASIGFMAILILVVAGLVKIKKSEPHKWQAKTLSGPGELLSLLLFLGTLFIPYAVGLYTFRYYALTAIGLILLVAGGIARTSFYVSHKKSAFFATAFLITAMLPSTLSQLTLPDIKWKQIMEYIERNEQAGEDVIIGAFQNDLIFFYHYYEGDLDALAIRTTPEKINSDRLYTLVRTNAYQYVTEEAIDQLGEMVSEYRRVFFVRSVHLLDPQRKLYEKWFSENGWRMQDKLEAGGLTNPQVDVYVRDSDLF